MILELELQSPQWTNPILLPPIPNIIGERTRDELDTINMWLSDIADLINEVEGTRYKTISL